MDFGQILDQWDTMEKSPKKKEISSGGPQVSHKKANAPSLYDETPRTLSQSKGHNATKKSPTENQPKINPMELWLRRYGTIDKDKESDDYAEKTKLENREYLRTMKPEAKIDLHGLTADEAEKTLSTFVADCVRRGLKKILIVHGKGNHSHGSDPVLGPLVRRFIENDKRLGSSGHPDRYMGGTGATWVIIK